MSDRLSTLYQDVVSGSYDCVDRILLNGYFGLCHSAGGFRLWWRQLTGSDQTLDKTHLMRLAGRPVQPSPARLCASPSDSCGGLPVGGRQAPDGRGVLGEDKNQARGISHSGILVGRAQAPGRDVNPYHHLKWKKPMPFVNHYSFHILDPDWGHVTIKISGIHRFLPKSY